MAEKEHGQAWVPVDACTLPTAEQPVRLAEFADLLTTAVREVQRRAPGWLRLYLDRAAETAARDLTARESACCSFFDFRFGAEQEHLVLDVRVPPERIAVLDGLTRQAGTEAGPTA